jgi:hypothetical protein
VKDTVESAKARLRDAAEAVEPKSAAEAVQADGGIPTNTADLLKGQELTDKAISKEQEGVEDKVWISIGRGACPIVKLC